MSKLRNQATIGRAGLALAGLALAACAPTPAGPTPSPSPTAAPGASPTPVASATAAPSPSATPSPVASGAAVTGTVYDLDGAPLAGVAVHAHSVEAAVPFDADATTDASGQYGLAGLPPGTNLAVTATKPGWTTRKRLAAFAGRPATPNMLDFGAAKPDFAGAGAPFFLSDLPEVTLVDPVQDGTLADPTNFHLVLAFPSGLDADNQRRFGQALRVFPASSIQQASRTSNNLANGDDLGYPDDRLLAGVGAYQITVGTIFRGDAGTDAHLTWNADGTQATFDFAAPPARNRVGVANYQLALAATKDPIVDRAGHQLGMDSAATFNGYPKVGHLVRNVFTSASPQFGTIPGLDPKSREYRWAATHDDEGRFRVSEDDTTPTLQGIAITPYQGDCRIALVFDEPLVAYDGSTTGLLGKGLNPSGNDIMKFSFALEAHLSDLASLTLDNRNTTTIDPRNTKTIGAEGDRRKEVAFDTSAIVGTPIGAKVGNVVLQVDPDDPRRVLFTVVGLPRFVDPGALAIKARVEGLGDPAGNVGSKDFADANVYSGNL